MGLNYIPHQGRSFLGVTKSFVASGARSNKQTKDPFIVIQLTTPTVIINIIFGGYKIICDFWGPLKQTNKQDGRI